MCPRGPEGHVPAVLLPGEGLCDDAGMTSLPPGPDPAELITDQVIEDTHTELGGGFGTEEIRAVLIAGANAVIAAWQRWEESQLDA